LSFEARAAGDRVTVGRIRRAAAAAVTKLAAVITELAALADNPRRRRDH